MAGRQGMVARVDGWPSMPDGSLVVLQHGAGLLAGLVGAEVPEPSWRCVLLGSPMVVGGQRQREFYLPERCLTAVSAMNADQVQELVRQQAETEVDALVAEIGRALGGHVEIDDAQLALAGERALLAHCLEVVATATALREAGFREIAPGSEQLRLEVDRGGSSLRVDATQTKAGIWVLACSTVSAEAAFCSEIQLPAEASRGQVMVAVLRAWRGAFPGEAVPARLSPGAVFQRHQATMEAVLRPAANG